MNEVDGWTAKWTADKVNNHEDVQSITIVSSNLLSITTKQSRKPLLIATLSVDPVERQDLVRVHSRNDIEFMMNAPKGAVYKCEALSYAEENSFGLGGLGDLYSAIGRNLFRGYLPKEMSFILRGLRQHTKVQSVLRITDRLYKVNRHILGPVIVLALNEYDLTAEAVRTGIERHGQCDIILASNPNCRPSTESIDAARSAGCRVLKWGELLGALNYANR